MLLPIVGNSPRLQIELRLRHLSEPEKRAFVIADNRLPELASWDETSQDAPLECPS
jgi:hypothetical protein